MVPKLFFLAQASAHVLTQETAISWPIVVAVVTVAAVIIESRVKIAQLQKDHDAALLRLAAAEMQGHANDKNLTGVSSILGEIKQGIRQLHEDFHRQRDAA